MEIRMPDKLPPEVRQLVEQFARHRDDYRTGKYNETQLRRDYLDPFFKALGWDIDNEKGFAEAYRQVFHEDAIKIGGTTKAPDYSFRIGGLRKFFVEAKKPAVNLKNDPAPALQLRRYAWTAKLPISILTDFEEFAIYDCRQQPKETDKAHVGRLEYFTFDQFEQKWNDLVNLLSPEAIQQGAFDKYATKKKICGTADVDDVFLDDLQKWRQDLAKHLITKNKLNERQLNHAVQLIIDRIVFLRICEDRGIEAAGTLLGLTNGSQVYDRLLERFRAADQKYNSGLFNFEPDADRRQPDTLTPSLTVGDKPLKTILENLYPPASPYEFSVMPADILGQVYERFLGSVISLSSTGKTAKVEEKPEVRKAGGVYYTPRYIVDYIVEQTVGELLEDRKVTVQEQGQGRGRKKLQVSALDRPLTVLDPACGSGSFLLGAFDHLLAWYLDYYVKQSDPGQWATLPHPPIAVRARKDGNTAERGTAAVPAGDWKLTTTEKKRILLQHIYGVVIDAQAVEVTKLSLLLKVLEGESAETVERALFAKERALPDLSSNIKCGNSLIGTDFYDQRQMSLFSENDMYRINAFDWHVEFADIIEKGGFDAVIGNPPYVRVQILKDSIGSQLDWLRTHYASAKTGNIDIYILFLERGYKLLSPEGLLDYIVPSKFLTTDYGEQIRSLISGHGALKSLVDFGHHTVFTGVSTYTCLVFLSSAESKKIAYHRVEPTEYMQNEMTNETDIDLSSLKSSGWVFTRPIEGALFEKRDNAGECLLSFNISISRGSSTGCDNVFKLKKTNDGLVNDSGQVIEVEEALLRTPIIAQ